MREMADTASGYVTRRASQVRELTRDHEGAAVAMALAAGFGIGLVIGSGLAMSHRKPQSWRDRLTAEGVGRRLLDRIEGIIPDALASHFGK